ncbi:MULTISPECIES: LrgB family protein [Clostridium]|uniref:LrgB family protein n=1 Tax=Clostridium aquiflavi TaxID=3073603 RepID=A0ABU1EJ89_9CLOT|nr:MULTISPECIES: LrgB family protein [unclassified Clostridium]MDR5588456.1 LrgB family protein [Clostridium sp. 5N-1]NFG63446.1 LrgB family protein [Clostridium botulinum]NFQ08768.1 LrgB family protein [Clostridium botulinum]
MDIIINNILFGLVLSLIAFEIGIFINKKTGVALLNPLLIAIAFIICFLFAFNIDFSTYNEGGQFINMFLGPSTVVLAVPLYKQIELLKKNAVAIFSGVFLGSIIGMFSVMGISYFVGLDSTIIKSLIPKSVTTPIGIEISSNLGGLVPITVLAIIITGIMGAILGPAICKVFKIKDKVAIGISIGTAAHAVGTTKALELGDTEGAMSSLSIGVAGLMTVFMAPLSYHLAIFMYHFIR